jgi:hypothetical protein
MAKTFVALIVWLSIAFPVVAAQSNSPPKKAPRPAWSELTPAQQKILAPLQTDWESLDTTRRRKWVAIANRYPSMTPQAQQRLQKRMADWAKLTPQQRQEARERYLQIRKLPTKKRQEVRDQWQQYQDSLAPPAETPPPEAPAAAEAPTPAAEPPAAAAETTPRTTQ